MALKKTLDELKELGCLNPEDYVDTKVPNLRWVCTVCNSTYFQCLLVKNRKTSCVCPSCSRKQGGMKKKQLPIIEAKELGCLNIEEYISARKTNLKWECKKCGDIYERSFDSERKSSHFCVKCATRIAVQTTKLKKDELLKYSCLNQDEYVKNSLVNLRWVCVSCGGEYLRSFETEKNSKHTCTSCSHIRASNSLKLSKEEIEEVGVLNPECYINAKTRNMKYSCDSCGVVFTTSLDSLKYSPNHKHFCITCRDNVSSVELEMVDFIKSVYFGEVITNSRQIIPPLELDVYLPDLKLAIELNGVYWHSSKHKDRNYHKSKFLACKEKGIKLLQFWDITWNKKKDIIKSMLRTQMNSNSLRIPARTCSIKEVDLCIARDFLEKNHLQGFGTGSTKYLGLFNQDTMVSLMTFKDIGDNVWDLTRFCSLKETSVIGGASKLLKYFIKTQEPYEIISFSDNMYSNGGLYGTLGFTEVAQIRPDYKYLDKDELYHKFGYRHNKLKTKLENYDRNLTEKENCENHNIQQVFDAGKIKWSLKIL